MQVRVLGGIEVLAYRSTGEAVGSVTVPDAERGSRFVVSVSADGSTVAAFTATGQVGPWALWGTEPLTLRANGISGFEFGEADANQLLDYPLLEDDRVFTFVGTPPDRALRVADPVTFELVDDRQFVYAEGAITRLVTGAHAGLIAGIRISVVDGEAIGDVRVWDRDTGRPLGRDIALFSDLALGELLASQGRVDIMFDGAGRLIVQSLDSVSIWNYDGSTWSDVACAATGRNMTRDEWERYGPTGVEYRKTCDQYPITS